jgi:hypothetical protein
MPSAGTGSQSTTLLQDNIRVHTSGKRVVLDEPLSVLAHTRFTERVSPPSHVPIIVESTPTMAVHAHQEAAELIAVFLTIHATVFSRALFVEKHEPRVGLYSNRTIAREMKPYNISREHIFCNTSSIEGKSHLRLHALQ